MFKKRVVYFCIIAILCYSCKTPKKFTLSQQELILEGDSKTPMRVLLLTNKQDSILLRKKSSDIRPSSNYSALKHFADRLYSTVTDEKTMGVGIAAPQVGVLKNIICVQRFDKPEMPFEIYLNPKIIKYSKKKRPCPEGCLSIPNTNGTTKTRSYTVEIEYDKLDGTHHKESVNDFTSVIFQHEIDHLNGILFIDHLENEIK